MSTPSFTAVVTITQVKSTAIPITPSRLPSPTSSVVPCQKPSSWQIQYKRSGGITGQSVLLELSNDGKLILTDEKNDLSLEEILSQQELTSFEQTLLSVCPYFEHGKSDLKPQPPNCPDCYTFSLDVRLDQKYYFLSNPAGNPAPVEVQELLYSINRMIDELLS
jgi:hypothetical protein